MFLLSLSVRCERLKGSPQPSPGNLCYTETESNLTGIMVVRAEVGKNQQRQIWDYTDALMDKSRCLVEEDEKIRIKFKGKSPTILGVHLKSAHTTANLLEKVNKNTEPRKQCLTLF